RSPPPPTAATARRAARRPPPARPSARQARPSHPAEPSTTVPRAEAVRKPSLAAADRGIRASSSPEAARARPRLELPATRLAGRPERSVEYALERLRDVLGFAQVGAGRVDFALH